MVVEADPQIASLRESNAHHPQRAARAEMAVLIFLLGDTLQFYFQHVAGSVHGSASGRERGRDSSAIAIVRSLFDSRLISAVRVEAVCVLPF